MEEERNGKNDGTEGLDDKFQGKKGGKIKGRRSTAPASSHGYQTIRTQLQNKRATINETIGHEVELKKGAKRLIRYSICMYKNGWLASGRRGTAATRVPTLEYKRSVAF